MYDPRLSQFVEAIRTCSVEGTTEPGRYGPWRMMGAARNLAWVGLSLLIGSVAGCGEGDRESESGRGQNPDAEVTALAERYYDAFREGRLDEACRLVAENTLQSRTIIGANVRDGERPEVRRPEPVSGCALVRQRRRGWEEPIPRSAWGIDAVHFDDAGERARVDTAAEGSYWMRRFDHGWLIVGFGSLTARAVREFGGKWPPGVVSER